MDYSRGFTAAVGRTVTRCLMAGLDMSDTGAGVQVQHSLNPLLPPGCVPLVELIGLEAVVDQVLAQMAQRDGVGAVDESDDDDEEEEDEEVTREYPDNQQECTK